MLVLRRNLNERIILTGIYDQHGKQVEVLIELTDVCSNTSAKIGIEAPTEVRIMRTEVKPRGNA